MRILHLICSMGGGGAEKQLCLLAKAQAAAGHDVHVALVRGGPNLPALQDAGCVVHRIHCRTPYDPRFQFRLRRHIDAADPPDIVHSWMMPMDVHAAWLGWRYGAPWVLAERGGGPIRFDVYPFGWPGGAVCSLARVLLARSAGRVIPNSTAAARHWARWLDAARITVIPNIFTPAAACSGPRPQAAGALPLIVAAGQMIPRKNWPVLLQALAALQTRGPEFRAVCCGDGPERAALEALARTLGLEATVTFPGYVTDLPVRLAAAAVCVSLSRAEGMPNVVLEAIAAERPLVLSDIPAHRDIVPDDAAEFVPPDDHEACARALESCLADPGRKAPERHALAQCLLAERSPAAVAAAYEKVYDSVLAAGASADRP